MTEPVAGIDVASWQGSPDWRKVAAAGFRFAYIKASEGNSTSYPTLNSQYAGARAAGLSVGLYHYARVAQSATSNADSLAAQVNRLGAKAGHLPPCLDLEEGAGNLAGWADTFIERLRARTGIRQVMVYSGAAFFTDHIGEGWMDPDIYLWIAHYGRPPGQPRYLTPRVAIHQHSQTGKVPGISGACDLDVAIWPLEKLVIAGKEEDEMTADEVRQVVREEMASIAKRDDIGWARSQILAALGVANPEAALGVPAEGARPITQQLDEIRATVEEIRRQNPTP